MNPLQDRTVLVVGAGIMGAGIAQVAAQAGHTVFLFDVREGAAAQAKSKLEKSLDALVVKGRMTADLVSSTLARIVAIDTLDNTTGVALVVEAIVEKLDTKRELFRNLEGIVGSDAILASNTSSISITAIANGLRRPERLVGMHFFNPVPQMKLVEVVSGLQTDPNVAQTIEAVSAAWGKVPVHAKSTPGFIVNRIARPYYAESLALLQENAASPQALDACLRAAGFRMGPFELMDMIGHDTNFAVTSSVFEANFYDKRYAPSLVQRELVDGGLFGRKTGRGFYSYPAGAPAVPEATSEALVFNDKVTVHGDCATADYLEKLLTDRKLCAVTPLTRSRESTWVGLEIGVSRLVLTDGRTASELAATDGVGNLAVFDRLHVWSTDSGQALGYAVSPTANGAWRDQAPKWLSALGFNPILLTDTPGLVVSRTMAMLINEAADAVLQGVCSVDGANAAMKLGVNYPAGPFEWLAGWSTLGVQKVLEALDNYYRGERYRVSPWLRRFSA